MPVYFRTDLKAKTYWYRFQIQGRRFHGNTGCTREGEAKQFERQQRTLEAERLKKPQTSLDMIAARWWREIGEQGRDQEASGMRLERLVSGLGPNTLLADLSFDTIAKYVADRRRQPTMHGTLPAPATVNREVQLMRRVVRRAVKWGYESQRIDWGDLLGKEPPERVVEISQYDEMAVMLQMPADWQRLFAFLIISGWRVSATCALRWDQVKTTAIESHGKGGAVIRAIRTEAINEILDGQRGAHPTFVFAMKAIRNLPKKGIFAGTARVVDRQLVRNELHRACRAAGIAPIRVHDLRHTAATRYVRATGSLKGAQKLLDHARIETTGKYAHVTDADLEQGMNEVQKRTVLRTANSEDSAKILKMKRNQE